MKIIIVSLVSLFIGLAIGWNIGYSRPVAKTDRYVWAYLHKTEDEGGAAAVIAMDAIQSIDAGKNQKAVQQLSLLVANYYQLYAVQTNADAVQQAMRLAIEELAKTNPTVAALIKGPTNNLSGFYSDYHLH